jgi:hypothetical protein
MGAKVMQVSSGTSISSSQALLQAAQLSDLSSSLFGTLSTQTTTAAPTTATTSPTPTSNLLSSSLTQALINSTQVDANATSTSSSATDIPSIQSVQAENNLICVFEPPPGTVCRDNVTGQIIQPVDFSPNVTQNDLAVLKAAFGYTKDTQPDSGIPITPESWNAYQKMLGEISYARGQYAQGAAVITGNLTAAEFTRLANESANAYQLPLTPTQLQKGLDAIENGIPDSTSSSSAQNQAA